MMSDRQGLYTSARRRCDHVMPRCGDDGFLTPPPSAGQKDALRECVHGRGKDAIYVRQQAKQNREGEEKEIPVYVDAVAKKASPGQRAVKGGDGEEADVVSEGELSAEEEEAEVPMDDVVMESELQSVCVTAKDPDWVVRKVVSPGLLRLPGWKNLSPL
ncbi:hypothetical protein Taro_054833 [Colocasia esculenta]|uniref:Uncharacterized protein n=1 Tax=Colocasia esculenta TaxID=4460 RepID=A0A843XPI2_COLES|nr:hypothetical protein [Colocasia esculenta]